MAKLGSCKCCSGKVSSEAISCPHCGQPEPYSDSVDETIREILKTQGKVPAIKQYRELTDCTLSEGKRYVDSLWIAKEDFIYQIEREKKKVKSWFAKLFS